MGNGETRFSYRTASRGFLAILALILLAGCATTGTATSRDRTIWQLRDQYVKVEKQDAAGTNAHPVIVPAERLRAILEDLQVQPLGERGIRLFNDDELDILSEQIHAGLLSAGPDEDVTFAVVGQYPSLMGLKQRMVTTGRVFSSDQSLNIIFGNLHRPLRENEDRRLLPFLPGRRTKEAAIEGGIAAKPAGEPLILKRPDWVVVPLEGPAMPAVVPAPLPAEPSHRGEQEKSASPAGNKPGKRSIGERLSLLNELHDKKLISDEEYRLKRLEILNEL